MVHHLVRISRHGEEATRTLRPGDYVELPAHTQHSIDGRTPIGRLFGWPCV